MFNKSVAAAKARPTIRSRRAFLGVAALLGGAGAFGSQALGALTSAAGSVAAKARRLLPTFSASAASFGQLVGADGNALAAPAAAPTPAPGATPRRWVMVIDLARCDGCGVCTESCNKMHNVPAGQEWIHVIKMQDPRTNATYWMPKPCFQCDNSPCTKVCPVSATFKREDGVVLIDQDRCIGCRYCMAACPYSTRWFNWTEPIKSAAEMSMAYDIEMNMPHRKGVAEKCLFCPSLLRKGELPACAADCSMGAIWVGDEIEDLVSNSRGETQKFSKLIADNAGYRFLEELGTAPRVWYLPPRDRKYAAPQPETKHSGNP